MTEIQDGRAARQQLIFDENKIVNYNDLLLQNEFITLFTLGNIETCLYIVDVDAIRGPLFVFQNYLE